MDTYTTVLVACVAAKLPHAAMAKNLYVSPWFKSARRYAEQFGDNWAILSAKHGFVLPEQWLEPYEMTLNDMSRKARESWANSLIASRLQDYCGPEVEILAGKKYREFLVPLLESHGKTVTVPMRGLGIGQQLQYLNRINACTQLSMF